MAAVFSSLPTAEAVGVAVVAVVEVEAVVAVTVIVMSAEAGLAAGAGDSTTLGESTPASLSCRSVKRWRTTSASGRTALDSNSLQTDTVEVVPLLLRTASKASTFVFTEEALNGLQVQSFH